MPWVKFNIYPFYSTNTVSPIAARVTVLDDWSIDSLNVSLTWKIIPASIIVLFYPLIDNKSSFGV